MQNIGFLEFFVKEKTKTRAPAHLRNHSKSVGIARTLLIWHGRHVRPRYASVACWFRGQHTFSECSKSGLPLAQVAAVDIHVMSPRYDVTAVTSCCHRAYLG